MTDPVKAALASIEANVALLKALLYEDEPDDDPPPPPPAGRQCAHTRKVDAGGFNEGARFLCADCGAEL